MLDNITRATSALLCPIICCFDFTNVVDVLKVDFFLSNCLLLFEIVVAWLLLLFFCLEYLLQKKKMEF